MTNPTTDEIAAAKRVPADKQTPFEAGCEVLGYLREIGAPYYYTHRANIALHGNPPQAAARQVPPVDDLLAMAVECGVIRMSQVMNSDLQDALTAFAKRLAG